MAKKSKPGDGSSGKGTRGAAGLYDPNTTMRSVGKQVIEAYRRIKSLEKGTKKGGN